VHQGPRGLHKILAEQGYGADLLHPHQDECVELVEDYALHSAVQVAEAIGIAPAVDEPRSVSLVVADAALDPSFEEPLTWLLRFLAYSGVLVREDRGELVTFRRTAPWPPDQRLRLRERLSELDPGCLPNVDLFDAATVIYSRAARGEVKAEQALLARMDLWGAYFSNRNSIYSLCNRVMARAAVRRLPTHAARVLEVGAGLGSGTEAMLEALREGGRDDSLGRYEVTELIPFFRSKASRFLAVSHPEAPLAFAALDINKEWAAQRQGAPPHLVVGCNVLHLARDLVATLRWARATLAVGGWLVAGECIRPFAGQPLGAELPLELLASYRAVDRDERLRPDHGFLTPEQWLAAFTEADFVEVSMTPDVRRSRAEYPRFVSAAIVGRRAV
jgi:hypothetical protein